MIRLARSDRARTRAAFLRSRVALLGCLLLAGAAVACEKPAPPPPPAKVEPPAPPPVDPQAPDSFRVRLETSRGPIVIELHRPWAPRGVDRFHHLVTLGYFDGGRFFRVIPGFIAQFGMNGDPKFNAEWAEKRFLDDPRTQSNARGTVTFAAASAPNTRSTQLFINYADNAQLDQLGFAPIGKVVEGMKAADGIYGGYGDAAGMDAQAVITGGGNKALEAKYPKLDYIKVAKIEGGAAPK